MKQYSTIFNQILSLLPENEIKKAIAKHGTDRYSKSLSTFQLLKIHLFAHIAGKISLRDISSSLSAQQRKLHRLGLREIPKSTLAYANEHRSYQVFEDIYYALLKTRSMNSRPGKFKFKNPIYALDTTNVDLCLSLFEWAHYQRKRGAIRMHYMLDLRSDLPAFLVVTNGKKFDSKVAKESQLPLSSDSIVVFDKGYIDYKWFKNLDDEGVIFVTRARKNTSYRVLGQQTILEPKRILFDEKIEFDQKLAKKDFPRPLRLITMHDGKSCKTLRFLTNDFKLSASTIADIYQSRWQIESFFRWIKQNLNIKTFLGTSKNAVMLQIWAAMIYYLVLSWIKFQAKSAWGILELSRRIRSSLFENLTFLDLLASKFKIKEKPHNRAVQMQFF